MPALPTHILPELPYTELVYVQGGSFLFGDNDRPITIPDFAIGKYPVTQALWQTIMKNNPSQFKDPCRPVESASWHDAQEFLTQLNLRCGSKLPTRCAYRLPNESEWEYAARGGIQTQNYEYAGGNDLDKLGWYDDNSHGETKAVGLKLPNKLGIHDMSGNVWEWCEDHWHWETKETPADGSPWLDELKQDAFRVIRGGSWSILAQSCRSAARDDYHPTFRDFNVGFRVVFSLQAVGLLIPNNSREQNPSNPRFRPWEAPPKNKPRISIVEKKQDEQGEWTSEGRAVRRSRVLPGKHLFQILGIKNVNLQLPTSGIAAQRR